MLVEVTAFVYHSNSAQIIPASRASRHIETSRRTNPHGIFERSSYSANCFTTPVEKLSNTLSKRRSEINNVLIKSDCSLHSNRTSHAATIRLLVGSSSPSSSGSRSSSPVEDPSAGHLSSCTPDCRCLPTPHTGNARCSLCSSLRVKRHRGGRVNAAISAMSPDHTHSFSYVQCRHTSIRCMTIARGSITHSYFHWASVVSSTIQHT